MSRFAKASKRMNDRVFDHMGVDAIFEPLESGAVTTRAILHLDIETLPGGFESAVTFTETHISMPKVDVPKARRGDVVIIDDEVYTVEDLADIGNSGDSIRVIVV